MKEFIMSESFKSRAEISKYITTRKIKQKKILSIVHDGKSYVLFYYTTIRNEEKYRR